MSFHQQPPTLGNQYEDDRVLRSYLRRALPSDLLEALQGDLLEMGRLAAGPLLALQQQDRPILPRLLSWSPWAERIDHVEVTPAWRENARLAAEHGLVARAYQDRHGRYDRIEQFALAYLFIPSTDLFACPLALTDGAARTLLEAGNTALLDRALPRLTSREAARAWTSGLWMSEAAGGSDVGLAETLARQDGQGRWRLFGRKAFVSGVEAPMALVLARPEGNPPGRKGLGLFYLETRDEAGRWQGLRLERLRQQHGARKLPTAEVHLDGAVAVPVAGLRQGMRTLRPMLTRRRTWTAVTAVALMRRGLALARDYAQQRSAFGQRLAALPLHADTLAGLQAEYEAAFHLTFRVVELVGYREMPGLSEAQRKVLDGLLGLVTALAQLTTGRQAVGVMSEVVEAFGGVGYDEETGLPGLLRDAQALPLWGETTNMLSLEVLRVLEGGGGLSLLEVEVQRCRREVRSAGLVAVVEQAEAGLARAGAWLSGAREEGEAALAGGARRLALTVGRSLSLALLARHGQWSLDEEGDGRAAAAAHRFATAGINLVATVSLNETAALANDTPLPERSRESAPAA